MIERTLGRYVIEEEIGHGVMGTVYRAHDPALERVIALKTVRLGSAAPPQQREAFEKRFLAEARGAACLSHPAIVIVHDVGRDEATGTLFIAFEHLEGRTLNDQLADGPLPWREALRVTGRLAEALHHAHTKGIVHRDIKPANIMILPTGEPKIMDFGVARLPFSEMTSAGQLFGTPSFMSPEQAVGETVDGRSDIFSLGAVAYLMLTGRSAFGGDTFPDILVRIQHKEPEAPTRLVAGLPERIDVILAHALAKNRDDRYQNGRELAEDAAALLDGRDPPHCDKARVAHLQDRTIVAGSSSASKTHVPTRAAGVPHAARTGGLYPKVRRRAVRIPLLIGIASLLLAFAVAAVYLAGDRPASPIAAVLPIIKPAQLELTLHHDLQSGTVRVYIDDILVIERPVAGAVKKKVLFYKAWRGSLSETIEVAPGERAIRVQVIGQGASAEGRVTGVFQRGVARRLEASYGGLLGKKLELSWRN